MTRNWIPHGIAFCELRQEVKTESFVFVLLPNLSMNAFSSAIEPLRIANQVTGKELFRWRCLSESGDPVLCSNGVPVGVDGALKEVLPDEIVLVCSGILPDHSFATSTADRLRMFWRRGQTVGGICTGAYLLARAGILKGSAFTLHWENLPAFREKFADLQATEQLFHISNRIWTCAGGLAATDMMVDRISQLYGKELAGMVANMCLLQTPRSETEPQKASAAATIGIRNTKLVQIVEHMEMFLDDSIELDDIAAKFQISRRQLERLFSKYLSTTPRKYLMMLRLHRARSLMAETSLGIPEVSAACGFATASHFSKRFKEAFGISPRRFSLTRHRSSGDIG
ncbi:GlxA family transcriptional regulator [Leisingera sp. ANG59]|uniref:GlxA family transcriptional regulator n=1 Tax=Leisingera sp. ANG59 TaxID=2675221 RepID=UPI001572D9A5|nr:GlxA family transcriptional regulator [Leisingera sp. ANG59]NSY40918.1 helix-turn-helix domain-containing protein [Leisingera sp. ANG59]